ncbi:MAG: ATP-binding protein [Syntrophobacteraceae bacterium]|nr:ATP-binding protein [Syntrophobacteraceae bacterium]
MSEPSHFLPLPRLLKTQPLRWLLGSVKGQILALFLVTSISASVLTLMDYRDLSMLKRRLLLEDRYHDLLDNVLEVRRYEKNYLLYKDRSNLVEGGHYLAKIEPLVLNLSGDMVEITSRKTFEEFHDVVVGYAKTHRVYQASAAPPGDGALMRRQGRELTDFATMFLRAKQKETRKAIENVLLLPFAFLGVFFLLMLLVMRLVSLGLLRPLKRLQTIIRDVATGDYNPGGYEGFQTEEMHGLIEAFDRMARELAVNQEHLLQAGKMAALGTFTAGIAHELNNPLNNISLTAETYLEEYGDRMDDEGRELIGDVLAQSERACDIVKNLLDFSRTRQRIRTSVDASEIVRSTVSLVKNQAALSGVKLDIRLPEGLPPVRGSLRSLQQVFSNLLINAVQAMAGGGTLTVDVKDEPPDSLRFDIRDTGMGMDPETVGRIFEPFFTTKEAGKGTGLGLAVVYSIVKRHGGSIGVKSEIGAGTVFTVLLPVAETEGEPAGPEQERSENAAHAGGNS